MIRDHADASLVTIVDPTRYGRMMVLSNDRYMGQAFTTYGEYSESEVELWRQLIPPHAVVADIGANIGAHTVAFARLVPDGAVIAFEPLPFMFAMLQGNIALNGLTNVRAFNEAVGAEHGKLTVPAIDYTKQDNYGGLCLIGHNQGNPVPMVRLDDRLAVCHFLKVDVEGMEQSVLEGAQRIISQCRPALYLENNPGPGQQTLIDYVHGLGYDIWWHRAPLFNPENLNGVDAPDEHTLSVCSHNILCLPSEGQHDIRGLEFIPPTPQENPENGEGV